jgi:co-chaperonin GroES (HSP10)
VRPASGLAFIRHIETESTYRGGTILIPETARDKVAKQQFVVVAVGDAERCEDEDCNRYHDSDFSAVFHPCDLSPGDWVLCRNRSWSLTPDPDIFVIRQGDMVGRFVE